MRSIFRRRRSAACWLSAVGQRRQPLRKAARPCFNGCSRAWARPSTQRRRTHGPVRSVRRLGRPQRDAQRHRHGDAGRGAGGHARSRRPGAGPGRRCRRSGTGCTSCRCTGRARSAPTATRGAAASCRRCRCRAACGPAAGSSSTRRCASATRSTRISTIAEVADKEGRSGTLVFVTGAPRDRATPAGVALDRGARHRLSRAAARRRRRRRRRSRAGRRGMARARSRPTRAAVPLLGADLQRPPHPLRPPLRRPTSRAIRAWSCTAR